MGQSALTQLHKPASDCMLCTFRQSINLTTLTLLHFLSDCCLRLCLQSERQAAEAAKSWDPHKDARIEVRSHALAHMDTHGHTMMA